jgi:hypothetical protein
MNDFDLISPDVSQLILLFSSQPDLRFPDLDSKVLHEAVARVKDMNLEVAEAEAALQLTKAALDREHETLLRLAQRAHAYLKVFAETDERLNEQVEAISLPKPRRAAPKGDAVQNPLNPPKKRGRPRKDSTAQSLFAPEESAASV